MYRDPFCATPSRPAPPSGLALLAAQVDPGAPWLRPYAPVAHAVLHPVARGATVADALNAALAARAGDPPRLPAGPLRFVAGDAAPEGEAYEAFIFRTARVPTRDNLHDLFNGLVWLTHPRAKARLNALQAGEIARSGIGGRRGALRDALTLFDENGAVLDAPSALWSALRAHDWRAVFVGHRACWEGLDEGAGQGAARAHVFGHALLEKLCTAPRKNLTAHVLRAAAAGGRTGGDAVAPDDAAILAALDGGHLAAKPFSPLPVLGIPGWHGENANFSFYDDSDVFRPRRPSHRTTTIPGGRDTSSRS